MADPSYYVPSAQIHAFMMYAPFLALYEKRGMLVQGGFLLLTGPVMAAAITPNLMEQASIWCFFSIAQIDGSFEVTDTFGNGEKRAAGDYMFDPAGLRPKSEKDFAEMQAKEINNGRLAMMAIAGMVVQELVTTSKLF